MTKISLIAAMSSNMVIGKDNKIPWHLPEDMKFFRAVTMGKPVIMGRKTFESIGKALPGRRNIVLSRSMTSLPNHPDVEVYQFLDEALASCVGEPEAMVIGGAEVYRQAVEVADRLYLTFIDMEVDGDTFFPEPPRSRYPICQLFPRESSEGVGFSIQIFSLTDDDDIMDFEMTNCIEVTGTTVNAPIADVIPGVGSLGEFEEDHPEGGSW